MNAAKFVLSGLLRLEQGLTSLAFACMVLVLGWDIVSRELLGGGRIWATPIAVYGNVLIAFIGMGVASAGGAHLRPKFFDRHAPMAWSGALNRLTDFGFAAFCVAAAWLCWVVVKDSVKLDELDPVMQWPVWPFQCIVVLGFGFGVLRHTIFGIWPALRPQAATGESDAPSDEQVQAFKREAEATWQTPPAADDKERA
jgi:TRAP-type C4-dicarboxylate transport system permease small subunit